MDCKCERCGATDEHTDELHSCPYQSDVGNDDTPVCNCCADCQDQCAMDI